MKLFRHSFVVGFALVVVVSLLSGCAVTPIRQHPDFASAARKVQSIAVLPPDVEHVRIVFNGDNERLTEKELTVATELTQGLETSLKNKHYMVQPWLDAKQQEQHPNLNFDLQQVRTAYNEAAKQLFDKSANEEESKKYRVTLGPVVNPIATVTNAEALLYARFYGFEKSGGQQTKDILAGALLGVLTGVISVPHAEGAALEVALIDGVTGDVLWANRGGNAGPHGLGFGAPLMAENILTRLPNKDAVVVTPGNDGPKVVEAGVVEAPAQQ